MQRNKQREAGWISWKQVQRTIVQQDQWEKAQGKRIQGFQIQEFQAKPARGRPDFEEGHLAGRKGPLPCQVERMVT